MADLRVVIFSFSLLCGFFLHCHANQGKYSEDTNQDPPSKDIRSPFRMQKVNLVWQKAMKKLTASQQEDLYVDLKIQDKLEMDTKKKVSAGLDEDGEHQAYARDQMKEILMRHNLHDHFADQEENETWEKQKFGGKDSHMNKLDKKIAKLWKKAQTSGFTEQELAQLKTELLHHQQKMDEYKQLKNEIDAAEGIHDNSIDGIKKLDLDLQDRKQMNKELKAKYRNMKDDLKRLEKISSMPPNSDEFTEDKVIQLWALAKKANFSETELESLKEELIHFQHKVKKHIFYEEQVRTVRESLAGKSNESPAGHVKLEQQLDDYGRKVDKYHREIKKKISKSLGVHGEL